MSPEIERAGIPLWQKAAASGVASLDGDSKVVQNPATSYLPTGGGEMTGNITMAAAETVDGVDVSAHAASLAAHMDSYGKLFRTGQLIPNLPVSSRPGGTAIAANTLYAVPLYVLRDMSFSAFTVQVTNLAADASARLGVYNDGTNLYPGTLVSDLGVVSVATTGLKTITPGSPIALTKGLYWLAVVSDGTPSLGGWNPAITPLGGTDTTDINYGWNVAFTYAALPTPFTAGGSVSNAAANRMGWLLTVSSLD